MRAYVGTYTGATGNLGDGEGIYSFDVQPETGELTNRRLLAKSINPSWIVIHPSRQFLYTVNEYEGYEGGSGSVSAFAIHPSTGDLKPLNVVSSHGAGPAYMSLDASGRFCLVANYGGGSLAVLPILQWGDLGKAVEIRKDTGAVGSTRAADGPPGSFAISGHDAPHVHMIHTDPRNRFALATDLGQDRIYSYRFDSNTGKLSDEKFASLPSGDGPRHFVFHPNGRWFYSIQEEASTVVFFTYDAASGSLEARQTVSTLPPGFAGTSFASEILMTENGRFLYAANRLHDTIAMFSVGRDGRLERMGEVSTMGDYPAQCVIAPGGRFLYACNRRSDDITCFHIDGPSGRLHFTGRYTAAGSPGCIAFLG